MTYVPIVTPTNAPPLSPRTRELAGLITKVMDEYTKAHPATTKAEIRAAVRMAQASAGGGPSNVAALLSLSLGLGVAALTFGLFFFRSAGGGGADGPEIGPVLPMIIMALIVLLGLVMVIAKRR